MILRFDRDLTRVEVLAQGAELANIMGHDRDASGRRVRTWPDERTQPVATLSHPVLVTDHHRIGQLPPVPRDTVFALLASPLRVTAYDGIELPFEQARHPGVWGPSIDTLLLSRALSRLPLAPVRRALEIGCGSGFLSKVVLARAPGLLEMTLVDLSPHAAACARELVTDPRARVIEGDGIAVLGQGPWDLIVCNPPYIPRPHSIDDNPYEGVGLLRHLLEHGPGHLAPGGRLIVNVSSLGGQVVADLMPAAAATPIDRLEVPLKVFNVLNSGEWLAFLANAAGLTAERRDGYDYWHTITILEMASRP